jgi:hypothetical protein
MVAGSGQPAYILSRAMNPTLLKALLEPVRQKFSAVAPVIGFLAASSMTEHRARGRI